MAVPDVVHVSYTQLQTWRQCRRKWHFQYVDQLKSRETQPAYALYLGIAVHEALDAYYDPASERKMSTLLNAFEQITETQREEIAREYAEHADIADFLERFDADSSLGAAMVSNYGYEAPQLDHFDVLYTEHQFDLPLGIYITVTDSETGKAHKVPVNYRGRIDGVIQTEDGRIRLFEHKTAKNFQDRRLFLDQQATSYIWAAQQMFDLPVDGVLYNILRKQRPGPRVKSPLVYRLEADRSMAHIRSFPETVKEIVRDMEFASNAGLYFHNPNEHCVWCPFFHVCQMIQDAADVGDYLKEYFEFMSSPTNPEDIEDTGVHL